MRKLFILMAALGLIAASCGGGASADSCEGVADEAIEIIQEIIDEFDSLSLADLESMDEEPEAFVELEARGEALETKADDLGCSDAEMDQLFGSRVGNLKADGFFGELMIDELTEGGIFSE